MTGAAEQSSTARGDLPVRASVLAAGWAFCYAMYRAYYALGGTVGMFGVPLSESDWRRINAIGAVIVLVGAILPIVMLRGWRRPRVRKVLFTLCWLVAVGCVMHALVDIGQRLLSLTGRMTLNLPYWKSIDRRAADLQDLLFNEPWFLVEGLLWGAIAWTGGLARSPRRRWWIASAGVAVAVLTVVGLLSATGVIGRFIVG
jgi:hypothetical protein